jgi:hypothetical protein
MRLASDRGQRLERQAREHLDAERAERLIDLFDFSEVES